MCEFLIMAQDTSNIDKEEDKFAYKAGHVVAVMPDGHRWGTKEGPPRFYVIKVPDMKVEDGRTYEMQEMDFADKEKPIPISMRQFKLDTKELGTGKEAGLLLTGVAEVTKEVLTTSMKMVVSSGR